MPLTSTQAKTAQNAVRDISGGAKVTPVDALAFAASNGVFILEVTPDVTTALATSQKACIRAPFAFTVTDVEASLHTVSSSGIPTFDVNKNGTTILPTKLTIDVSEKTSRTAATAPVLSSTAADLNFALDDELIVDVDVAGTSATGARVYVYYQRTA